MSRIVGDSKSYDFFLKQANGRYNQEISISLPSVTSVLSLFAKPSLMKWHSSQTIDSVSGIVAQLRSTPDVTDAQILDEIDDAETLRELLKENKARPEDISRAAMERGTTTHDFFERLMSFTLPEPADWDAAIDLCNKVKENPLSSGHMVGVADWFLERLPRAIAVEYPVYRLEPFGGFMGTLDGVYSWVDREPSGAGGQGRSGVRLVDLKTGKDTREVYVTDEVQVGAYEDAWVSMGYDRPDERTILLVKENGTWEEHVVHTSPDIFYHLLGIHQLLDLRERNVQWQKNWKVGSTKSPGA